MAETTKADHWRERLRQFDKGGVGVTAFCRQYDLPIHQFYYWRAKLDDELEQRHQLVPVVVGSSSTQLTPFCVRLPNGVEIESHDAVQLEGLLPALASL